MNSSTKTKMESESSAEDELSNIDLLRLRLEDNIAKLQKSLQVWRTWEAEFEGLKEEILTLPTDKPSKDDLITLGRDYGGTLVDEKGMEKEGPSNALRTRDQIVDVLSRRVDYVRQNAQAIEKQIQVAQTRLDSISASRSDAQEENSLPLTEIRENLDEEGNVISIVKSTPESAAPELIHVLEEAGITEGDNRTRQNESSKVLTIKSEEQGRNEVPDKQKQQQRQQTSLKKPSSNPSKSLKRKKSVRFTEDTKLEDAPSRSQLALRLKAGQNGHTKTPATKRNVLPSEVLYRPEEEEDEQFSPVIPVDESPEDAALRREMLQYGLSEVGAVVAELKIEENEDEDESVDSDEEDHDYNDGKDDLEEEEDEDDAEDNYGRTTRRVVSEAYVQEMKALQEKLEGQPLPNRTSKPEPQKEEQERNPTPSSSSSKPKQKKLPISDSIIEHNPSPSPSPSDPTIQEPDEFDPAILKQEIAVEYHNMRNRMIYRQGGFLNQPEEVEEEEKVPLTPEEGGETKKKVSRFKAARLGR